MRAPGHLQIDPRLAAVLGETYHSSAAALKELVDNAWDADAEHVWITLPAALSSEPIVIRDDGAIVIVANCQEGMTSFFGAREYKLSSKAKAGELSHAEDPTFWEVEMTHRERYAAITWLRLLCPSNSRRWHVRHEAQ